jgi:hypothetical protein
MFNYLYKQIMKNLFFGLLATGFVTLSSFTSVKDSGTVPCKWRTVVTIQGVAHYSEWTEGNCNRTESGKLIPIRTN